MLDSEDQFRLATQVVAELERKVKAGTATAHDRKRLEQGRIEILVWEWEPRGNTRSESKPVERVSLPDRDPRAVRCADWWERIRHRLDKTEITYAEGYAYWTRGMHLTADEDWALYDDFCAEIHERRLYAGTEQQKESAA